MCRAEAAGLLKSVCVRALCAPARIVNWSVDGDKYSVCLMMMVRKANGLVIM